MNERVVRLADVTRVQAGRAVHRAAVAAARAGLVGLPLLAALVAGLFGRTRIGLRRRFT
ncbi:MAG: hypothetical protein JWQ95_1632 [Sphaerisporangium sp.]|jgi:hypothetical protein|nr:hypothetical protein [Sphaerisporangium sp.]